MPWAVKDVDRHKKGLTPAQKKKWVSIANAALKSCQAKGGKNCEASAIRIANSKFSKGSRKMNEEKLPKGALRFVDSGCHAYAEMLANGDEQKPSLKMVAYSGGVIKNHWYWDDLAIDLEGIQFKQKRFPVLEDHMTDRKIAHIGKPVIENGKLMAPDNAVFLKTEAAQEFIQNTSTSPPFPYQSSIYAKPTIVERVAEGASVEVNGFKLKGPATVWRACEFKEMSVCVFGWDSKTQASAFSREVTEEVTFTETEITPPENDEGKKALIKRKKEVIFVDVNELKEKHPDLVKQIEEGAVKAVKLEFSKKEESFNADMEKMKVANETLQETVAGLEKKDEIRTEKEMAAFADRIWEKKLSESNMPERPDLQAKIKKHVSYHKFVDENGKLDTEKFGEAIDAEIKVWAEMGVTDSVIGSGFSKKEVDETETNEEKLAQDTVDVGRLLKHLGQEQKSE